MSPADLENWSDFAEIKELQNQSFYFSGSSKSWTEVALLWHCLNTHEIACFHIEGCHPAKVAVGVSSSS
ncbi:hypothetical protein R1flu_003982 [Riccia fluitans]|uniref:Uncharacterized protein n=1 Tax=Riccia fluitans TaxID=41844 RepID=A0ABD1YPA1_9MARC